MNEFITAKDFFRGLHTNEKVYLLIRHAERFHIVPTDTDKGEFVTLTERGREQARTLGTFFPIAGETAYFSSPVGRCIDTANCIAQGREQMGGPKSPKVKVLPCLGDFFVKDFDAYRDILNEKFYPSICEWIKTGSHPAFYPLASRSEELKRLMFHEGLAQFNVFVTHDSWTVPCLSNFCNMEFTPSCWMNFLTGIAFVVSPDGQERIVPITGMDSGFLKF